MATTKIQSQAAAAAARIRSAVKGGTGLETAFNIEWAKAEIGISGTAVTTNDREFGYLRFADATIVSVDFVMGAVRVIRQEAHKQLINANMERHGKTYDQHLHDLAMGHAAEPETTPAPEPKGMTYVYGLSLIHI